MTSSSSTLSSRDRVLAAFARTEPDRVPLDYYANPGIDARLKQHFGLAADDHIGLYKALGIDMLAIRAEYTGPRLHPEVPGRQVDPLWGIRTKYVEHPTGGYWDFCDFPMGEVDDEAMANWSMPDPDDFDYAGAAEIAERHHEDFCLYVGDPGLGDCINSSGMARGMEKVMMDMALHNEGWLTWIDRKVDIQCEIARRTIEAAKGRISVLFMGEDLGTQRGPMISLDMYRDILRPRHQRIIDLGKSFDMPVMIHSCGSSSWVFDDLAEMGMSVIDTLQPEAENMSPEHLKSTWGDRLAFHGCISTAGPLAFAGEAEVEAEVRKTLEIMMPGGGYCLSPTHMIQDNTSVENVLAMYRTAHEAGVYR